MRILSWLLSIFFLPALATAEASVEQFTFRTTFEEITLPHQETMGLQGFSLLQGMNDYWFLGVSGYGALTGQRGGFITLGIAADASYPLSHHISMNTGLFVGGGGGRGGYSIQGGGLQVRSHLGMGYYIDGLGNFGLGASYQDFPNGNIHSFQPYMSYEYDFDAITMNGWSNDVADEKLQHDVFGAETAFSLVYRNYVVPAGVRNDEMKPQYPNLGILGIEWRRYVQDNLFIKAETEGALVGQSKGFMQIMFGGGYRFTLTNSIHLKASASLGVAGGGKISTAGGLLLSSSVSLQQFINDAIFVEVGAGYVLAPDGDFKAASMELYLGSHFSMPTKLEDVPAFNEHKVRMRLVHQTYTPNDPKWRNHHPELNVGLLGFQNDYFLSHQLYLTGQAIAAYAGKGGNYMTGLIGGGLHYAWGQSDVYTDGELLVGAAGGGGLDVGGGLVWQANMDIGYRLSDTNRIALSYGQMQAFEGNFKAHVFAVSLAYDFSLLAR